MTELMTASEVRRLAKEILTGETKRRLSNVAERIIKAAFEGQNSIRVRDRDSLYNDLTSTVIQTLKDKGYTVEHTCSQRDMESWYNISWAK